MDLPVKSHRGRAAHETHTSDMMTYKRLFAAPLFVAAKYRKPYIYIYRELIIRIIEIHTVKYYAAVNEQGIADH